MRKIIISAVALNNVIGMKSKTPWIDKDELNHFKETTLNNIILMGRKTFESIGKVLPKRKNIVLTSNKEAYTEKEDLLFFNDIKSAVSYAEGLGIPNLYIIGGSEIYDQTLNIADEIIISRMPFRICGDRLFPEINEAEWMLNEIIEKESFTIEKYIRK
jgi:dihydrofolate reductase